MIGVSEQINYYPPDLDTGRSLKALHMVWRPADDAGLQALARELSTGVVQPLDELEMAALMESMGVTDEVAVRRYGAPDVFALAAAVMELIHQEGTLKQTPQSVPETGVDIRQTLTDFLRGPLSLVAIGVLVLIMMAYHQFGRWGHAEVLALSLGITGSMFITNGFVQAAARRGSIYWGRGNPLATLQYLRRIMFVAAGCALCAGLLLAAVVRIWAGFTTGQALIFFLSFCTLSLVWLMAAVLVVLEASAWFGICLLAGLLVGGLVDRLLALAGSPAHLICGTAVGFVAAMAVMFLVAHRAYSRGRRSRSSSTGVVLPSTAYLLAEATPYFIYGTLYMAFVLSPHVLGWLGRRPAGADWLLAMEPLELGLSLAMIPLLLASGVAENTSRAFWSQARVEQSTTPEARPKASPGGYCASTGGAWRSICSSWPPLASSPIGLWAQWPVA